MCYFITISIPDRGVQMLENDIPDNLHLTRSSNPSIQRYLPGSYLSYIVTSSGCSCDLFSEPPDENAQNRRIRRLRKKYSRKGWSKSRIERSVLQIIKAATRQSEATGLRDDLRYYLYNICNRLNEMKILVHFYSGSVETERISIPEKITISIDEFMNENPIQQTDTLFSLKT